MRPDSEGLFEPQTSKREIFELKEGATSRRPDRVAARVFEQSLRSGSNLKELGDQVEEEAAEPRGGTLALSRDAPVSRPRALQTEIWKWREPPAQEKDITGFVMPVDHRAALHPSEKGGWRGEEPIDGPRPGWERPWREGTPVAEQPMDLVKLRKPVSDQR